MGSLTDGVKGGGCSCKIGPSELGGILRGIDFPGSPRLIVGMGEPDDAGVYLVSEDLAIIQTVDFFPPMVEDPFLFGRIAAANSMSDVYAMGGVPVTALNVFCFPVGRLPSSCAGEILSGGAFAMREAGCALAGGHSLADDVVKYGLAVTGTIRPDRVRTKGGVRSGDALVLTKPIGTGVISTAVKAGLATREQEEAMTSGMACLNKKAAEIMGLFDVSACTDITGFGLFGHLCECSARSGVGVRVSMGSVPLLPGVLDLASEGLMPAGLYRNRDFYSRHVSIPAPSGDFSLDHADLLSMVMFDPQTSGGLAVFVSERDSEKMVRAMRDEGVAASVIGFASGEFSGVSAAL